MALRVRNITNFELQLIRVEHYHRPRPETNFSKYITDLVLASIIRRHNKSPSTALYFEEDNHNVCLRPFRTTSVQIEPPKDDETFRIFIAADGNEYYVDLPILSERSVTMTPVDDKKHDFTAIYSRKEHHLALFTSCHLESWMKDLQDSTSLTGLSIPGTHNSPTCHRALPSVRCQAVSPREQMENGVRFFDLRVQPVKPDDPNDNRLILVHSVFSVSLLRTKYFQELLDEIFAFLQENPSETMLLSLKREGFGQAMDHHLGHILRRHYTSDANKWFTSPYIPTLGEVRGKIVLVRRFKLSEEMMADCDDGGWGINAEAWADNTPHALSPDGMLCVQDFYEVLETQSIQRKIQYTTDHLARAAAAIAPSSRMQTRQEPGLPPLFFNFLSGSNFWRTGCWPQSIAEKLNPAVLDYLCQKHNENGDAEQIGQGTTGIVVCDWIGSDGDWDLVGYLPRYNSRVTNVPFRFDA